MGKAERYNQGSSGVMGWAWRPAGLLATRRNPLDVVLLACARVAPTFRYFHGPRTASLENALFVLPSCESQHEPSLCA